MNAEVGISQCLPRQSILIIWQNAYATGLQAHREDSLPYKYVYSFLTRCTENVHVLFIPPVHFFSQYDLCLYFSESE